MFYRYDEISLMTDNHMAALKNDQACCRRAREMRKNRRHKKKDARSGIMTLLFSLLRLI